MTLFQIYGSAQGPFLPLFMFLKHKEWASAGHCVFFVTVT